MCLSLVPDLSTIQPEREKAHHLRRRIRSDIVGDGADLGVDFLHDLTTLLPDGGHRGRLGQKYGEADTKICLLTIRTEIDFLPPFLWNWDLVLLQAVNLLICFCSSLKRKPRRRSARCLRKSRCRECPRTFPAAFSAFFRSAGSSAHSAARNHGEAVALQTVRPKRCGRSNFVTPPPGAPP